MVRLLFIHHSGGPNAQARYRISTEHNILDYTGSADKEFDGEPAAITQEAIDESGNTKEPPSSTPEPEPLDTGGNEVPPEEPPYEPRKYYVHGGPGDID